MQDWKNEWSAQYHVLQSPGRDVVRMQVVLIAYSSNLISAWENTGLFNFQKQKKREKVIQLVILRQSATK